MEENMITNPMIDTLMNRRAVRIYKTDKIEPAVLDTVLEVGTFAPNGRGLQLPLIVAVQDPADMAVISRINGEVWGRDYDAFYGAPAYIIVFNTVEGSTYVEDGACSLTYMMVAAKALGLDSVWVHRQRQTFETEEGKLLKKKWGIPDEYVGVGAISIGYADGPYPKPAPRKAGFVIRG
jgi:nitroreductase